MACGFTMQNHFLICTEISMESEGFISSKKDSVVAMDAEKYNSIASSCQEREIKRIDFRNCPVLNSFLEPLSCSALFRNLSALNLFNASLGSKSLKLISRADFENIVIILLEQNNIGNEGGCHLMKLHFKELCRLDLKNNPITQLTFVRKIQNIKTKPLWIQFGKESVRQNDFYQYFYRKNEAISTFATKESGDLKCITLE